MPVLDPGNSQKMREYSDFVASHPRGHMMQAPQWAQVKNNWDADYVYVEDSAGKIVAALSILSICNDGQHAFMYAPRGPVCELDRPEVLACLLEEASAVAEKRHAFLLRMDPFLEYSDERFQQLSALTAPGARTVLRSRDVENPHAFSNPRHNMILEFEGRDYEEILSGLKSKRRNQLLKTYKNGVETRRFRPGDPGFEAALDTFYELTKVMAERQGISYRPKAYFNRLLDSFPGAVLYQAGVGDEVLCSSIQVCYNWLAFYIYSASSNEKRQLNAPIQLCMEQVRDAVEQGMTAYDMGGTFGYDESDGLFAFKSKITEAKGLREFVGELDFIYDENLYRDFVQS